MTSRYVWDRFTDRDPALRAADADREGIADRLRAGHADGRLDLAEFQQRLERCYRARTLGELDDLVGDLPRPAEPGEGVGFARPRPWPRGVAALAPILLLLIVASAAAGRHAFFLLWVPLVFLFWRMSWWRHRRWLAGGRRAPGDWI